ATILGIPSDSIRTENALAEPKALVSVNETASGVGVGVIGLGGQASSITMPLCAFRKGQKTPS
ncbi:hypothetical protein, partial [Acetobacter cibinongensis]|uniref:hypothetical protein n=1 Tax=Acetobacter cibinongensis TaxID=146475 RepID=UPI00196B0922